MFIDELDCVFFDGYDFGIYKFVEIFVYKFGRCFEVYGCLFDCLVEWKILFVGCECCKFGM